MTRRKQHEGFSLVEVTVALALITFCLVTLLCLLPLGLDAMKRARDQAAATNCLEQIAHAIDGAVLQTSGTYQGQYQASGGANGPYSSLVWTVGGTKVTSTISNLSSSGFPSTDPNEQRFIAAVEITPPANAFSYGTAIISVAWPVQATWNSPASLWKNDRGSVRTLHLFIPNS